jgi:predicted nucleic acid-binding protein
LKVLVDTSVWSLALRRKTPSIQPEVILLQKIIGEEHQVFLTGVILMEILQGFRERHQFEKIHGYLDAFPMLDLNRDGYAKAALLQVKCRKQGVQSATVDSLIAQTAMEHECHLLTADQDFTHIARCCELKLL